MKFPAIGLLALALGACKSSAPQDSSSSHWLECNKDKQCLGAPDSVGCSAEGYCVTAEGERVTVESGELGTSSGGDMNCEPLAVVQQPTELGEFIALLRSAAGTTYLVDRAESNLRVFIADGDELVPQEVAGTGEGSGRISISLSHEGEAYSLLLTPEVSPDTAWLSFGDPDKNETPEVDESLEVLPESELEEFTFGPVVSPMRVEYNAQASTGEHILVVVPERNFEYESFRLFYGDGAALIERRISEVLRSKGGGTVIDFLLDGKAASVNFTGAIEPDETGGAEYIEGPAIVSIGEQELELAPLPKTSNAIADLTASCFASPPNGWSYASSAELPGDLGPDIPDVLDGGTNSDSTLPERELDSSTETQPDPSTDVTDPFTDVTDPETDVVDAAVIQECRRPLTAQVCVDGTEPLSNEENLVYIEGTVVDSGTGYPSTGTCGVELGPIDSSATRFTFGGPVYADGHVSDPANAADASWFVVRDASDQDTLVVLTARGFDPTPLSGTAVDVELKNRFGGFAPSTAQLTVTTSDGAPILWIGEAGTPEELSGPVPLSLGEAECDETDTCVSSWSRYSLYIFGSDAGIGPDVKVPYGTQVQTPNWVITNSAVDQQNEDTLNCPDAYVALARAAIWPAP